MRALLDTNIVIHREAATVVDPDIGHLFRWLDRLGYEKSVHPVTLDEIQQHGDDRVRRSFAAKLESYHLIKVPAPMSDAVRAVGALLDTTPNDRNDTTLLNELHADRVDLLLTEDRGIARKAQLLGLSDRVFTIDAFLEKVTAENPELRDYKVLAVRRMHFGELDLRAPFFDSFRRDYPSFDKWFNRKADEVAYVCRSADRLVAFLYLKSERHDEPYPDITPVFAPKRRLKIGTFKVELNGFKLGERFLKIAFDNALEQQVDEIYVTIYPHSAEQERLIKLLEDFGFNYFGQKQAEGGSERVYVRDMQAGFNVSDPKRTFPFVATSTRQFIVPIYPAYHTDLLPDSILRTESPADFVEQEPHRNAIRKVYVSRSYFRDLHRGDTIVFYRTGGYYKSVVSTLGIVEEIDDNIVSEERFIRLCRKRSVFTDDELKAQWRYSRNRPFIVSFLYAYSFPRRPNMKELIDNDVIKDVESAPRGFEPLTTEQFQTILRLSQANPRIVID